MIRDIVILVLAWAAAIFALLAAVGLVRMPDLFTRLQAASKVPALSISLIAIAVALRTGGGEVAMRALALMLLVFVTSPLSAHMIARSAFVTRAEIDPETRIETDEN